MAIPKVSLEDFLRDSSAYQGYSKPMEPGNYGFEGTSKAQKVAEQDAEMKRLLGFSVPIGFENIRYSTKEDKAPHPMIPAVSGDDYKIPPVDIRDPVTNVYRGITGGNGVGPQVPAVDSPDRDSQYTSSNGVTPVDASGDFLPESPDKLSSLEVNQRNRDSILKKILETQNMTGRQFNGGKEDKWYINLLKGALNGGAAVAQGKGNVGEILGGVLAGAGANAVSPNLDNRIDRDRSVDKQMGQLDLLNQQIGQQLKEQQVAGTLANYKSLEADRVADNTRAANKDAQAAKGVVLNSITKVFNNATLFDPDSNIRDKEIDKRFFELTGTHLPKLQKGYKGLIKSDEHTGEQTLVVYNPNNPNEAPQTTTLKNKDGSKLIAFGPTTVAADAAAERQDKDLQWKTNNAAYERQTRIALEKMKGDIDLQVAGSKDKSDALKATIIQKAMGDVNYQMAIMAGDTDKAEEYLKNEVQRALSIYQQFKTPK